MTLWAGNVERMLTAAAPAPQTKSGQSLSSFIEESDGNLSTDCVEFKAIKQRPSPTQLTSNYNIQSAILNI